VISLPADREASRRRLMRNARAQIDEGLENQRVSTHKICYTLSFRMMIRDFMAGCHRCLCAHQTLQSSPALLICLVVLINSVLYFASLVFDWTTWTQRQRHFLLSQNKPPLRRVHVTAPYLYICVTYQFHLAATNKCLRTGLHATLC